MDVDVLERHAAGEVLGHHDHPGDPEEDDVVARDQHARGQVEVVVARGLGALVRPAQRREREQGRGEPGVEHVLLAAQRLAGRLGLGFLLAARDVDIALVVVPGRDLVAPPELARDGPVLDVLHPVVVGVDPVLGHEAHLARAHHVDRLLRDRLAVGAGLGHGHVPLVGQHRLDDGAGARAARHHQLVLLGLDQEAQRVEVGHHGLARHEAVEAAVFLGRVVVDGRVEREDADGLELVALAHRIVVVVVRGRDLHHAGAEGLVDVVVGDHRDQPVDQRQAHLLADQRLVALVFRMDHHGRVAEHGLGPGGGHRERARAVFQRVGDVPEPAVLFLALDLEVAHGGLERRVPVHQALAAVDQALFIELDEGVHHHGRELLVHGEVFAAPVDGVAHAAHLLGDGVAAAFLPLPDLGDEVLACFLRRRAHLVAADVLRLQLALDHDLGRDARVIGARQPQRVVALHAVVAREAVHDRLVERMAHVQRARHVGRRQLDRERAGVGLRLPGAAPARVRVAALFPFGTPVRLEGRGFERFGKALEAGLGGGCGGFAHGGLGQCGHGAGTQVVRAAGRAEAGKVGDFTGAARGGRANR